MAVRSSGYLQSSRIRVVRGSGVINVVAVTGHGTKSNYFEAIIPTKRVLFIYWCQLVRFVSIVVTTVGRVRWKEVLWNLTLDRGQRKVLDLRSPIAEADLFLELFRNI